MSADTSLTVEVTVTVKVRQRVNIVSIFQNMDVRAQERYRTLDITELGFDAEWERPLAYLWPDEHDTVPLTLAPHCTAPVHGDLDETDIRLLKRGESSVYGSEAEWTHDDFETLTAQVPWLRHFHDKLGKPTTQYDLDRIPGPDDVPLF